MNSILQHRFRIPRRGLLQCGLGGLFGLSLADGLCARDEPAARGGTDRRAILIWLGGGPSHHDTLDPKPDGGTARGEFSPIDTSVAGIQLSESMPRLATRMQHAAILRAVTHPQAAHESASAYMISGNRFRPGHNFPSMGSLVGNQRRRSGGSGLPPYIAIPHERIRGGGHLGASFNPLSISGDPNRPDFRVPDMTLPSGIDEHRFQRRRVLANLVNNEFRSRRNSTVVDTIDQYAERAFEMILSPAARAALNLSREPDAVRERYGRNTFGQRLLMSRRLIEAGVPFVTVRESEWDHHRNIFQRLKQQMPDIDHGLAALIGDLAERGRLAETLIIVMGEFGRTPKINENAGRDHWSQAFSVLLAGGGISGGQVIGASDRTGSRPVERPVTPEDLFHTVYRLLGIDPERFLKSTSGRDIQIVRDGRFIDELV